jgi:tetratricopeptide (TPR) repeat protein
MVLMRLRRFRDALGDLNYALDAEPSNGAYLFTRGQVHVALGEWEAALADFGGAARAEQRAYCARARREKAAVLLHLGRVGPACEDLRALCASSSHESTHSFLLLGGALCTLGRWEEAAAAFSAGYTRAARLPSGTATDVMVRCLHGRSWAELHCGAFASALQNARAAAALADEEAALLRGYAVPELLLRLGAAEVCTGGSSLAGGMETLTCAAALVEILALRDRRRAVALSGKGEGGDGGGGGGGSGTPALTAAATTTTTTAAAATAGSAKKAPQQGGSGAAAVAAAAAAGGSIARRAEREALTNGWVAVEFAAQKGEATQAPRLLHEAGGYPGISSQAGAAAPVGSGSGTATGQPLGRSAFEADGDTDEDTFSDYERERTLAIGGAKGAKVGERGRRGRSRGAGSSSSSSAAGSGAPPPSRGSLAGSLASLGGESVGGFSIGGGGSASRPGSAKDGGGSSTGRRTAGSSRAGSVRGDRAGAGDVDDDTRSTHSHHSGTVTTEGGGGGGGGRGGHSSGAHSVASGGTRADGDGTSTHGGESSVAGGGTAGRARKFTPFRNLGVVGLRWSTARALFAGALREAAPKSVREFLEERHRGGVEEEEEEEEEGEEEEEAEEGAEGAAAAAAAGEGGEAEALTEEQAAKLAARKAKQERARQARLKAIIEDAGPKGDYTPWPQHLASFSLPINTHLAEISANVQYFLVRVCV